ncbi:hypothetical protein ACIRSS_19600 [Amycolatopsis sp. NPDC101161]|uniref:hypothetical protein n=1 Tax=Amycolatopsis sp. NPDC101161 TaxID=3363940 RepID=UPI003820CF3A
MCSANPAPSSHSSHGPDEGSPATALPGANRYFADLLYGVDVVRVTNAGPLLLRADGVIALTTWFRPAR